MPCHPLVSAALVAALLVPPAPAARWAPGWQAPRPAGAACGPFCPAHQNLPCVAPGPAYDNRAPVCRLHVVANDGQPVTCTGWLIGAPDCLITSAACFANAQFNNAFAEFNAECDACDPGVAQNTVGATYRVEGLLALDNDLGYALLDLTGTPAADWGILPVSSAAPFVGAPMYCINHSGGGKKAIVFGTYQALAGGQVQYSPECAGGADGAPVFCATSDRVEALHQSPGWIPGGPQACQAPGSGTPMSLIAPAIIPVLDAHECTYDIQDVPCPSCSTRRIDFGVTSDDFGNANACPHAPGGLAITTEYVFSHDVVFGTAVEFTPVPPPVVIVDDADCAPTCRSAGSPPFATDWWCQFRIGQSPGVAGPRAGVTEFSAELCLIDAPPGTVLMQGYDNLRFVIAVAANNTMNGTETLTLTAPPGQLIATVRVLASDPARKAGLSVDCLNYPDPTPRETCPWDCFDGDGVVGILDFLALLSEWGLTGTPCDFNANGVDVVDFLKLLQHWGPCPEP